MERTERLTTMNANFAAGTVSGRPRCPLRTEAFVDVSLSVANCESSAFFLRAMCWDFIVTFFLIIIF